MGYALRAAPLIGAGAYYLLPSSPIIDQVLVAAAFATAALLSWAVE